jgi:hypothetical protein
MDEARYDQLIEKRSTSGLSDEEANELGLLLAEKEGRRQEYANAGQGKLAPPPPELDEEETVRGPEAPPPQADPGGDPVQRDNAGEDSASDEDG